MSSAELAREVGEDFERILARLEQHEVDDPVARIGEIIEALNVLARNPEIGRPTSTGMRELVIGRRTRGFLALYRCVLEIDTVFVLAVRNQREAGYVDNASGAG